MGGLALLALEVFTDNVWRGLLFCSMKTLRPKLSCSGWNEFPVGTEVVAVFVILVPAELIAVCLLFIGLLDPRVGRLPHEEVGRVIVDVDISVEVETTAPAF